MKHEGLQTVFHLLCSCVQTAETIRVFALVLVSLYDTVKADVRKSTTSTQEVDESMSPPCWWRKPWHETALWLSLGTKTTRWGKDLWSFIWPRPGGWTLCVCDPRPGPMTTQVESMTLTTTPQRLNIQSSRPWFNPLWVTLCSTLTLHSSWNFFAL